MTTYETVAGTQPDTDEQHEARTITRTEGDGTLYMMSEIGDGTFVQWGNCDRCTKRIKDCSCKGGPKEPAHIERWRVARFADSFLGRGVEPALPEAIRPRDRRIAAVMRFLLARGYRIEAPIEKQIAEAKPVNLDEMAMDELTDQERQDFADAIADEQPIDPLSDDYKPLEADPEAVTELREAVEDLGRQQLVQHHPTLAAELGVEAPEDDDVQRGLETALDAVRAAQARVKQGDVDAGF